MCPKKDILLLLSFNETLFIHFKTAIFAMSQTYYNIIVGYTWTIMVNRLLKLGNRMYYGDRIANHEDNDYLSYSRSSLKPYGVCNILI